MSNSYDDIQTRDRTDTATAAENLLKERVEHQLYQENLEIEAEVRWLISDAEAALVGQTDDDPEALLSRAHWMLWLDPDRQAVLRGDELPNWAASQFTRIHRLRTRGRRPDPEDEYPVLLEVAKAQGYLSAATDKTDYAPITLEHVDKKGYSSTVDEDDVLPIGRKRMRKDSTASIEFMAESIPHEACDHILTTASPRQGKDSTNARICGNLKDQHGYKWVSILDDGRNELPMIAIPNDEDAIRRSLERLGQEPKAYDTRVYVPAMPGVPDKLPSNFRLFTIGVDTLTPEIILRLAGKTTASGSTERRINRALEAARGGTGTVDQLVDELQEMAGEMEATVTMENPDDDSLRDITYQMEEDETLQRAANTLAQYAGDGLIEDVGADTNIDMAEVLKAKDRVAALNCNFLDDGHGALHYVIMDLWMQLIWQAADEHKNVPRVALEIRELKNVAPSQPQNMKYSAERRSTAQTIFEIASQGGSRGILMVGSTQKVNDVRRQIRVNMRNKIVLSNEDEGIKTLKESIDISNLEETIKGFDPGQGLIHTPGWKRWPVEFGGARCGLSDKDRGWLDRYGLAWGARVREDPRDRWRNRHEDVEWWVEVNEIDVRHGDEKPVVRDYYSDWFLLDRDFPEETTREDVDEGLVREVLQERREYPVKCDLSLRDVSELRAERTTMIRDAEEAQEERIEEGLEEYEVPAPLEALAYVKSDKRENMMEVLRVVRDRRVGTYGDIATHCSVSASAIGNYTSDDGEINGCIVKDPETGGYEITPLGEKALEVPWDSLDE
ncbi:MULTISPECIES: hypothetical protein [Halolamina]|uniref:Uncharacterized protein n=1 Tax=Halolamina pelagica TaxID=699431 RepID=A0A1I5VJQ6_9EURY|nr:MULTISPECIES: hypothetical protein [Halolamina]NHX37639.1 hypothetical protein [Halolamina sp. R1-12]SFQ07612.1 hypothetical protein SAMN05216277_11836 [Halolamina pelagica]